MLSPHGHSHDFLCPVPFFPHPASCLPSLGSVLLAAPLRRRRPPHGGPAPSRSYEGSDSCRRHPRRQVSPLTPLCRPGIPPPTTRWTPPDALTVTSAPMVNSRLRHIPASSPIHPAETGSSSYGLPVRLRLLPTPPHSDAVTVDFGVVTSSGADLHHTDKASSRTHRYPDQVRV